MKHENNRSKHFKKVLITQEIQKLVWMDKLSVEEYRLRAVSLFFLVRRAKHPRHAKDHARDWRREMGEASRGIAALRSRAPALPILNLKKRRDRSQSMKNMKTD